MNFIIATPVFNGMPALRRCIGSVRGQAATEPLKPLSVETPASSLNENPTSTCNDLNKAGGRLNATLPVAVHHIIQDGGSSDGSCEFLKEYAGKRETGNWKLENGPTGERRTSNDASNNQYPITNNYRFTWSSERDAGMYDAINKAWESGLGPPVKSKSLMVNRGGSTNNRSRITDNNHDTIVSWLNSDEQYLPGTLQKVAAYFEEHPHVDAVFGDTIITTSTGVPYAARKEIPLRKIYVANGFLYALSCSTFFRRSLWDSGLLKLDTQYRYSADADLVLRLLSHGVRFGHMKEFFALFGVEEGKNLSFRPEMAVESSAIKKKYGAFSSALMRKAVLMCRYAERLAKGCYQPVPVSFGYAMNEKPEYREYEHPELGFRFTYSRFKEEGVPND
jgi:GT2 family glycosyltransferase